MPQGYVRRSEETVTDASAVNAAGLDAARGPGGAPQHPVLQVRVRSQHDGEPILGREAGTWRTGGEITSLSSGMTMTASLMEQLGLRPDCGS